LVPAPRGIQAQNAGYHHRINDICWLGTNRLTIVTHEGHQFISYIIDEHHPTISTTSSTTMNHDTHSNNSKMPSSLLPSSSSSSSMQISTQSFRLSSGEHMTVAPLPKLNATTTQSLLVTGCQHVNFSPSPSIVISNCCCVDQDSLGVFDVSQPSSEYPRYCEGEAKIGINNYTLTNHGMDVGTAATNTAATGNDKKRDEGKERIRGHLCHNPTQLWVDPVSTTIIAARPLPNGLLLTKDTHVSAVLPNSLHVPLLLYCLMTSPFFFPPLIHPLGTVCHREMLNVAILFQRNWDGTEHHVINCYLVVAGCPGVIIHWLPIMMHLYWHPMNSNIIIIPFAKNVVIFG
jgi:hypothetical protein